MPRAGFALSGYIFFRITTMSAITTPDRIVVSVPLTGDARLAELAKMKASRKRKDKVIEAVLLMAACVSVFTTLAIVYILVRESVDFFSHVPLWSGLFVPLPAFGVVGFAALWQRKHVRWRLWTPEIATSHAVRWVPLLDTESR